MVITVYLFMILGVIPKASDVDILPVSSGPGGVWNPVPSHTGSPQAQPWQVARNTQPTVVP